MGSVHAYVTDDGKRYRVVYRKPDNRQTNKRGFRTKKEAELFLASIDIAKAKGEFIDGAAGKATIGALGAIWISTRGHLKPSTMRTEESAWRVHVEPKWGARSIGGIRHSEVQAWVTALSAEYSATTVKRAHGVLAAILDVAVLDRRLAANVARNIKLPRKLPKRRVYLSHEQVERLAEASSNPTIVRFLSYTGLRWGELSALRVRDLDMLRGRLKVVENAVAVGSTIAVGTPKTHAARSVAFPKFIGLELARQCEGRSRDDLIFGNGHDFLRLPHNRTGWFAFALRRCVAADAEFPRLTVHDLRHTAASLAISAGANVKAVQRMLGHASAAMTLDTYADLFEDDLDGVAGALERARAASNVAV